MRSYFSLKKTDVVITILCIFLLFGCSEQPVETEPEETIDQISGLYYLSGEKISTGYSCFNCLVVEDPYTNSIDLSLNVKVVKDKQDTVRFYGLAGADAGEFGKRVFPECKHPDNCKVYGKLTGIESFEIDIENNGRRYQASGSIRTVDIEVTGQYSYQNNQIEYDLHGKRVHIRE